MCSVKNRKLQGEDLNLCSLLPEPTFFFFNLRLFLLHFIEAHNIDYPSQRVLGKGELVCPLFPQLQEERVNVGRGRQVVAESWGKGEFG